MNSLKKQVQLYNRIWQIPIIQVRQNYFLNY